MQSASFSSKDHRHKTRQDLALEHGATDIISERGDTGVARIKELTRGIGADEVLECVGTKESMQQALSIARPGSMVGYVGVPHGVQLEGQSLFFSQVGMLGGRAPVHRFLPKLIDMICLGITQEHYVCHKRYVCRLTT